MKLKDAARRFGSVGLLFPLILLLLTAADSAFACPRHKTGVAYRNSAINNRTVSYMTPTVITYGDPVSYRRCSNNMYGTQSVRYVAQRTAGVRYVAVPNDSGYYPINRTRYIAARSIDPDDTSRYVVVRHSPAFVDTGSRYVAVRNYAPRTRSVAVRNIDYDDDAIRYVAVRRIAPQTRYVAVRNIDYDDDAIRYVSVRRIAPQSRYVAVRNIDYDDDALDYVRASNLDTPVDISNTRHVVVKTDYLTGTEEVIVPRSSYDDTAYIEPAIEDKVSMTTGLAYTPSAYDDIDSVTYHASSDMENTYPEAVSTRTVSYVPASGNNYTDDQAFIDEEGTTYVSASDVDGACLSTGDMNMSSESVTASAISYVPTDYVENEASLMVSDPTFVEPDDAASTVSYVPVADDDDSCTCEAALSASDNDPGISTVSYVPADEVADADPEIVSYIPAESVEIVAYE